MKPPSYLRQIAAPPRAAGDLAMLAPPRMLYRPSPAQSEFTVIEERATEPQLPRRVIARSSPPVATPTVPEPIAPMAGTTPVVSRPPVSTVASPSRQPASSAATAPVAQPPPAATRPDTRSEVPMQVPRGRFEVPHRAIEPASSGPPSRRAETSRVEPPAAPRAVPASPLHPGPAPPAPRGIAPPTITPHVLREERAVPLGRPRLPDRTPPPAPPVIMPLAPPAPPPQGPTTDRPTAAVRIGTLEVRVVAPSGAPVPVAPMPALAATRAAPAPSQIGIPVARLARGFGAFGLSQA